MRPGHGATQTCRLTVGDREGTVVATTFYRIDETTGSLLEYQHFSAIDLRSGYWDISVHEWDREKKQTFITFDVLFCVRSDALRSLQCFRYL